MSIRAKWGRCRRDSTCRKAPGRLAPGPAVARLLPGGSDRGATVKLPVLTAVETTLAFAVANWLTLVRIVWAPLLAIFGLSSWFRFHVESRIADLKSRPISYVEELAFGTEVFWLNAGLLILFGALGTMIAAGVFRLVIRGEAPSLPFNIRWKNDEWALFGTSVGLWLGVYLFSVVCLYGTTILVSMLPLSVRGPWFLLPFACLLVWVMARLSLALPAAIGRERIGIDLAWQASSGQFWRLLAYHLIWILLGLLFQFVVTAVVLFDQFGLIFDGVIGRVSIWEVNFRLQSLSSPDTFIGSLRAIAFALMSILSATVWIVALGVAWRMIDDERSGSKVTGTEGSASDIMGF